MLHNFENFINEDKKYENPNSEDKKVMGLIKSGLKDEAKKLDLYGDGNQQVLFFEIGENSYKLTLRKEKKKKK